MIVGVVLTGLVVLGPARGTLARWVGPDRAYSRDHQRLLDSVGAVRPIPARLSGGLPYRPYDPVSIQRSAAPAAPGLPPATRSGDGAVQLSSGIAFPSEIVNAIRRAGGKQASPEDRATLAALNLLNGDPDEAVRLFQGAHQQAPDDPRFLNDLAAALLAVHETTGDPWSAIEALEKALQAERLEPTLPALFNKALALERLRARTRAIAAWGQYLDADSGSPWAQEARQRLD
ncbi:MAG TPA: tetratricopeptide repeat protein, partial [Thermoanaerobaculia bacterium]